MGKERERDDEDDGNQKKKGLEMIDTRTASDILFLVVSSTFGRKGHKCTVYQLFFFLHSGLVLGLQKWKSLDIYLNSLFPIADH